MYICAGVCARLEEIERQHGSRWTRTQGQILLNSEPLAGCSCLPAIDLNLARLWVYSSSLLSRH